MRTVAIFPGRFQPFHQGHLATFKNLQKKFGEENVYIATSNSQAPVTSPFNFGEKQFIITQQGVPSSRVLQIQRPYNITEIVDQFGTDDIAVVFAVSDKDQERILKLISNEHYEPYPDDDRVKSIARGKKAYVLATPIVPFKIHGASADSARQIRDRYLHSNSDQRDNIIQDLVGHVDGNLREIFDRALSQTEKVQEFVNEVKKRPTVKGRQLLERVLQLETAVKKEENRLTLRSNNQPAQAWIDKVYDLYPGTFQNNHVMVWGEGDDQQFAMFELVPSLSKKNAVEVKWFQAYPLRQGVGSRAMAELQRLAQEDGIALTLYPWDKGQVSQSKLMKFYRGHGFRPTARGSKSMAWEPEIKENDEDLFEPGKQLAEIIAAELYRNKIEWHSIIDANSLNLALQSRGIPSYLLAKFRQLNDAERQELTDEVADVFWDRYEQHQWVPDDTPNLTENDDDLFEPTVSPVILKLFIELDNLCESIGYEFSANEIMMRSSEFWEEISDRLEGDTNPRHIIAAATHEEKVAIIDELRYYIRELRDEYNLSEDQDLDDLFEPSLRSKIMKVLRDRQIELKDYADREVRFGSKEAALSLWMDYRDLMKALNKNFDGTMRSMFDINVLHNLPENAVDDAIDTLEREQFNLERWVNPDYLPE